MTRRPPPHPTPQGECSRGSTDDPTAPEGMYRSRDRAASGGILGLLASRLLDTCHDDRDVVLASVLVRLADQPLAGTLRVMLLSQCGSDAFIGDHPGQAV